LAVLPSCSPNWPSQYTTAVLPAGREMLEVETDDGTGTAAPLRRLRGGDGIVAGPVSPIGQRGVCSKGPARLPDL
jgi:hypothetical protein